MINEQPFILQEEFADVLLESKIMSSEFHSPSQYVILQRNILADRQFHRKCGAFIFYTLHIDLTTMEFDNGPSNR